MAGTKAGAAKARQKLIEKFGTVEAYKAYMRTVASQGGKNSSGYAFAHGKLDQIETGRKGGSAPHKNRG